jgi:hypothetical protein
LFFSHRRKRQRSAIIRKEAAIAPSMAGPNGAVDRKPASQPAAISTKPPTAVAPTIRAAWRENSEQTQDRYRPASLMT